MNVSEGMRTMPESPAKRKPSRPPASPWEWTLSIGTRVVVWGLLFTLLYLLRSFFLLIFFTFVFASVQISAVQHLERFLANRPARVVLVATGLLLVLVVVGVFLAPEVKRQTEIFFGRFSLYIDRVDQELFELSGKYPVLKGAIPELKQEQPPGAANDKKASQDSPTVSLLQQLIGLDGEADSLQNMNQLVDTIKGASSKVASIVSAFLLSLFFSFLIVLDLPRLRKSVAGLQRTKVDFIYAEVAENIREFSHVLGQALQAQLFIAIVNSILTALGIYALGLGSYVSFLSVIVFFCSFIPVAGVFISSIPICLIALQTKGLEVMLLAILLVIAIHLIEGYVLNPRIYGSYMRINPVIVLIILTIGGELFHLWGLILGVPVCTYIFGYAIRRTEPKDWEITGVSQVNSH